MIRLAALALTAAALGLCAGPKPPARHTPPPSAATAVPALAYVAVGGADAAGAGTADPAGDSLGQQVYRALRTRRPAWVLYDLAQPGDGAAAALTGQVADAVALRPALVTVWLGEEDLLAGVPPGAFESALRRVLAALRGTGGRLLVGNLPRLDGLPALRGRAAVVAAAAGAYEAAIARAAAASGATVVDLSGLGDLAAAHPEDVGPDGLHWSAAGSAAFAARFAAAAGP